MIIICNILSHIRFLLDFYDIDIMTICLIMALIKHVVYDVYLYCLLMFAGVQNYMELI